MEDREPLAGCERDQRYVNRLVYGLRRYDVMAPRPVMSFSLQGHYTYKTIEQPICDALGWTKDKVENADCDAYTGGIGNRSYHEIKWNGSKKIYINHISMQQLLITRETQEGMIAVYFSKYKRVFVFRSNQVDLNLRWYRNSNKTQYSTLSPGYNFFPDYKKPKTVQSKREKVEISSRKHEAIMSLKSFDVDMQQKRERRENREAIEARRAAEQASEEKARIIQRDKRNEQIRGALKKPSGAVQSQMLTWDPVTIERQREMDLIEETMKHWKKMRVETVEDALDLTQPTIELSPEAQEVFEVKAANYFRL